MACLARPDDMADPRRRHLLHIFSTFAVGGPEVRLSNIMNHFGNKYRHTIAAMDGRYSCKSRLAGGLDIQFLSLPSTKAGLLRNFAHNYGVLRDLRPDLLLTYNWGAIEWAFTNCLHQFCRHIHFESGFGPEEAEKQMLRRVVFRRIALARAARIVVPSRQLEELAVKVWKFPPEKILFIANGIDCAKFERAPSMTAIPGFSKVPGELIVGTLAPLRAVKNIRRLIQAFASLAAEFNSRLLIVGDGPERADLTSLAARQGLADRVVFAGHVDTPEAVLGLFDVFAISSDTEQMPNALLQALAAGRPVAGMDVGDVRLMVAPENRRLIAPKGDERQFRDALKQLLSEADTRRRLGEANQAHVRVNNSEQNMFQAYRALFDG